MGGGNTRQFAEAVIARNRLVAGDHVALGKGRDVRWRAKVADKCRRRSFDSAKKG